MSITDTTPPVQFLSEAIAYVSIASALLARLSLVATYAFEPSFARTYYAIVFDARGPVQQFNNRIPWRTLLRYTDKATIFAFNYFQQWVLDHPLTLSFIEATLPAWQAVRPYLPSTYIWVALSTVVGGVIKGTNLYFEYVQNPDYRFLTIAVLVLLLYRYIVLKGQAHCVRFIIWSTVASGNYIVQRLQSLLQCARHLLFVIEDALYSLLDLAYWGVRLLSVLVLLAVDWFMSALTEVDKLEAQADTEQSHQSNALQVSWLIRKLLVWTYIGYITCVSWRPISSWIWSFGIVLWTWWSIRLCALTVWEAFYLVGSVVYAVVAGFVLSIARWLYRYRSVRYLLQPVVFTCTTVSRIATSTVRFFRRLKLWLRRSKNRDPNPEHPAQAPVPTTPTSLPGQYPAAPVKKQIVHYAEPTHETPRRSPRIEAKRMNGDSPDYKI
jgi:hypothetical protein